MKRRWKQRFRNAAQRIKARILSSIRSPETSNRNSKENVMLEPTEAQRLVEQYGTQKEAAENSIWSRDQIRRALMKAREDEPLSVAEYGQIKDWVLNNPHMSDGEIAHRINSRFRARHIKAVRNNLQDEPGQESEQEEEENMDEEIQEEAVRQAKKAQKQQDLNRIKNRTWRENARVENALGEYSRELKELLEEESFHVYTESHESNEGAPAAVLHATDLHLNEICQELSNNKFDFPIAAQRMKKFANRIISYVKPQGTTDAVLCFTGDILNNDLRRLDDLLARSTNRSKASFLAIDLLKQFIEHLSQEFNLTVVGVTGNESRKTQEMGTIDDLVSDNYDVTIFNFLEYLFTGTSVEFVPMGEDPYEKVVSVKDKNFLLTHGYEIGDNCEKTISQMKGRYAAKNVRIDYVLFGHLHSSRISDCYARGSSLVGANAYSERRLNLTSRPSQNLFLVYNDGNLDGIKVDLQFSDNVQGYELNKNLEAYNARSAEKGKDHKVIKEIVV